MTFSIRRIWSTSAVTAVLVTTSTSQAFAEDLRRDDGDHPGEPMGMLNVILWFVVLPLVITGLITVLTMGPSWTSAARKSTREGYLDDPTLSERQIADDRPQINRY